MRLVIAALALPLGILAGVAGVAVPAAAEPTAPPPPEPLDLGSQDDGPLDLGSQDDGPLDLGDEDDGAPVDEAQPPPAPLDEDDEELLDDPAGVDAQFYEPLSPYGSWTYVDDVGWAFRPAVGPGWEPYTLGHWEWTPGGMLWVSDEPFGWACFHYGSWASVGGAWFWIPGRTWAPSWVVWNNYGGYVGWGPVTVAGYAPVYHYVEREHFYDTHVEHHLVPGVIHHERPVHHHARAADAAPIGPVGHGVVRSPTFGERRFSSPDVERAVPRYRPDDGPRGHPTPRARSFAAPRAFGPRSFARPHALPQRAFSSSPRFTGAPSSFARPAPGRVQQRPSSRTRPASHGRAARPARGPAIHLHR